MHNQNRLFKLLKLISSLKSTPPKSVKLLARQFEISERTLYRYLDLLKEAGFEIQKEGVNKVFIPNIDPHFSTVFTGIEIDYLRKNFENLNNTNPVHNSVLLKLQLYNEVEAVSFDLIQAHAAEIIKAIKQALATKMQVVFTSYLSVNSNTVSDRMVEPIAFTADSNYVFGFEVSTQKNKLFALDRIKEVKATAAPYQFEAQHQFDGIDIFNFSNTGSSYFLDILLNIRAYVLLKKEFPQAIPYITANLETKQFQLQATIYSLTPLVRFIRGLPNNITVIQPQELITALQTK